MEPILPPKTVLLSDAITAIRNYRDSLAGMPEPHVYAFLIVHDDIKQALEIKDESEMRYHRMRAYLGCDFENGVKNWHLYIVPVDLILGIDIIPETADGIQYVYDFNTPCPKTCDITSPLYLA